MVTWTHMPQLWSLFAQVFGATATIMRRQTWLRGGSIFIDSHQHLHCWTSFGWIPWMKYVFFGQFWFESHTESDGVGLHSLSCVMDPSAGRIAPQTDGLEILHNSCHTTLTIAIVTFFSCCAPVGPQRHLVCLCMFVVIQANPSISNSKKNCPDIRVYHL